MATKKQINIPNPEELFNSVYIPFVLDKSETRKPLIVLEGGRGSAKSREISHHLTLRSLKNPIRIALVRKVFDTIRGSQFTEIQDVVNRWGLQNEFEFTGSPLQIKVGNGSEFICRGLDKASKFKSIANVDVVWVEEADELTEEDWMTLNFTIRGYAEGRIKQKILSFNRHSGNWTEKHFFNTDNSFKEAEDIYHLHTTYRDNRFLDVPFLNEIEKIRNSDSELYKKIAEGLPVRLQGLIYDNWRTIDEFPENCSEIVYGLDFGYYPDPTVLLKVGRRGMEIFIDEMIYDYKLTNTDLITRMNELSIPRNCDIYADIAEPDRIEEISRAGYYIHKGGENDEVIKDVEFGIDVCKRFKTNITARSTSTRKDHENYKWKVDRDGLPISPAKPAHAYSHSNDAKRYAVASHWGQEYRHLKESDMHDSSFEPLETNSIFRGF